MSAITATYCAFCEVVANAFTRMIKGFESYGVAIAASRLANMGYYKEAQNLMNTLKDEK